MSAALQAPRVRRSSSWRFALQDARRDLVDAQSYQRMAGRVIRNLHSIRVDMGASPGLLLELVHAQQCQAEAGRMIADRMARIDALHASHSIPRS